MTHCSSSLFLYPRAAHYDGHSPRRATSVIHARSVFTWSRGSVPRGSSSTGSVSAVSPAAPPCDREHMPSTLKRVCVIRSQLSLVLNLHLQYKSKLSMLHFTDSCCNPLGKLYCKLHFDQRNNGTNLRRNLSFRSVSTLL